jgi:septal ring-binding cell division protein DamX
MGIKMIIKNWSNMSVHNWAFVVLGILGLLLLGIGTALYQEPSDLNQQYQGASDRNQQTLGIIVAVLGLYVIGMGAAFHAVGKGRSLWFGLLGLFSPIGLLFLCVLQDRRST